MSTLTKTADQLRNISNAAAKAASDLRAHPAYHSQLPGLGETYYAAIYHLDEAAKCLAKGADACERMAKVMTEAPK